MKSGGSITLYVVIAAVLVSVCLLFNAGFIGVDAQQAPPEGQCRGKRDGSPCLIGGTSGRSCVVGRCRSSSCEIESAPAGTSCPDTDGNLCTIARCSASGQCDQRSRLRPDGTVCSDTTPGCRGGGQSCSGGQCLPAAGSGDPSQVARVSVDGVQVTALQPRVEQATSFNDCCGGTFGIGDCEEQHLEALVPTSTVAARVERDRGLPLRRKFCGTVMKYEVNDELDDPRDMNFNIRPGSSYINFLNGFVKTVDADLKDADLPFGNVNCDPAACLKRASEKASDPDLARQRFLHVEVTPDEHFYGQDGRFLPITSTCGSFSTSLNCTRCINGAACQSELEPRGRLAGAEVCVYGVFAYDHGLHKPTSHSELCCFRNDDDDNDHDHPEIHPYDAIWWRHPERNGWMFGVFQDDSNRYSFPHCRESQSNGNTWSQAPRDLTFEFPFSFPRRSAVQRVCLRHVRTTRLRDNLANIVRPLNVTTGAFTNPQSEVTTLTIGGKRLLELVKEPGSERETHVRIEGGIGIKGDTVEGRIILRVAVGCDPRTQACGGRLFDRLKPTTSLVQFDKSDPGAGYYYAELTFNCDCR